jgi:GDP-L-fucose synthase
MIEKPDYVFDAAAKVGGIKANDMYSAEFIYQNTMIQTNLIHYANEFSVKKFCFLGSVCIYPKFAPTPVKEESLLCGELEPTNQAYAIAKIHGIKMLQMYNKQYGLKGVSIMPCNLYGINDNFHPNNSHVIPGLIRRFHEAKINNTPIVTCWGDGSPMREFMFSDDIADACVFAMDNYENAELINVGSGEDVSIFDLAHKISKIVGYEGTIEWDTSKPNGTPKRPLDYSKISSLGWKYNYKLDEGLRKSYEWFKKNYE